MTKQKLREMRKDVHPKNIMGVCFLVLGCVMLFCGVLVIFRTPDNASALLPGLNEREGGNTLQQVYPEDTGVRHPDRPFNLSVVAVAVAGGLILLMGSVMIAHSVRLDEAHQRKSVRKKAPVRRSAAKVKR